jgi:hypothetical protein
MLVTKNEWVCTWTVGLGVGRHENVDTCRKRMEPLFNITIAITAMY